MAVLGRDAELGQIDGWLSSGVRPGPAAAALPAAPAGLPPGPQVLVIEGEPGIGKTTLWAETVRRAQASGWQLLSCRPSPSDAGLVHVGLADLLRDVPGEVFGRLPSPQRRPLAVALLREEPGEGDLEPRAVGTGLTSLLGKVAEAGPLMLAVDDAQWLDRASAWSLGFALRRLAGRPVRAVTAVRIEGPGGGGSRAGAFAAVEAALGQQALRRLTVGPLSVAAIHQMFRQVLGGSFARPVLVRIHQAAGGNPFYALEIARELQRTGTPPPSRPLPVPGDHQELALLRLRRLPRATRDTLAMVAAMHRPAAGDLDLAALAPAERAGIVRVRASGEAEFTHPLFGSALYSSLAEADRRALHRDLAARPASPEERARHLALAAAGPDEATAADLERASAAAGARGAAGTAAELAELACRLTPPADRAALAHRSIELAQRRYFAGDPTGARQVLEQTRQALPAGEERARVLLELGSVLWVQGESAAALTLMTQALREATGAALRARIHSRISSQSDDADVAVEHGEAALALLDEHEDPVLYGFALHNVALHKLYAGLGADHAAVEKGMVLQRDLAAWETSTVPAFWARNFDDFAVARQRFEDLLQALQQQGDEASISGVLTHLAVIEAMTGRMDRARELADEALGLAEQTEQDTYINMALWAKGQVCARAGEAGQARAACEEVLRRLAEHPDIVLEGMVRGVLGSVALTAGNLAEADRQLSRAAQITASVHNREPANDRYHGDHVEAVIGLGDLTRAQALAERLEARADALPRPWILAVSARCRGLLNDARGNLDLALADYHRALAAHESLDMPGELGRTLLALGRLHRKRGERRLAQEHLSRAVAVLESAGALGWAATARDELHRSLGRRGGGEQLTPTERKICELAVSGLRNAEIAARLFLSEKTVEANLSRAYRKLGVRSRTELAARMAANGAAGEGSRPLHRAT